MATVLGAAAPTVRAAQVAMEEQEERAEASVATGGRAEPVALGAAMEGRVVLAVTSRETEEQVDRAVLAVGQGIQGQAEAVDLADQVALLAELVARVGKVGTRPIRASPEDQEATVGPAAPVASTAA